ncbi:MULTISPECIES: carbohydrate kinase family protein [Microbacterium]|uniref:Carbohydrate kinase n=1 Tax=Microbacterium dauci TaxID=3048008 RepID=A0ABT6ZEI4_9MICO|nr:MULTISPECIES: carbohydrate kinase [unclassified Microbacterium]MDJ1114558.1 carbohydrate kinase [Microbacterium sp. LX3-4]PZU41275.1 MAG: carbohydrate kinase [Microbacterium sp.]
MTPPARVAVVGEALVDVVHRIDGSVDRAPGGSPANVALTLGRLGLDVALHTRLGDDPDGRAVRRWLSDSGVRIEAAAAPRTSTATARLDEAGAAEYTFDIDGEPVDAALAPADVLHVGSVAALLTPGADLVVELAEHRMPGTLLSYDPNIRPALVDDPADVRHRVQRLVAAADIVKASDEDVRWLHPDRDIDDVAREWLASGPTLVVVTAGSGGATAYRTDGRHRVVAADTTVVDTVGAGDTFMGTLVAALLAATSGAEDRRAAIAALTPGVLEHVLLACAEAAAITVSRPGADPPVAAELNFLNSVGLAHTTKG